MLAAYTRTLDVGAAPPRASCWCVALATFVATAWLFVDHPEGLLPGGGHRPDRASAPRPSEDISFPAMVRLQDAGRPTILRADPNVATVNSFNGGSGAQNTGRMFINLKPRAERAADEAGGRGPAPQAARGAGHRGLHAADPEPAARRPARARRSTSTSCRACRPTSSTTGRSKLQEQLRADPLFRDVTSDSQLRGLQAQLKIDRDRPTRSACRSTASAPRSTAPSASARCRPSTPPVDSYQVIMEVAPEAKQRRERVQQHLRALAAPARWCRCRASRPSSARSGRPRSTTSASCRR